MCEKRRVALCTCSRRPCRRDCLSDLRLPTLWYSPWTAEHTSHSPWHRSWCASLLTCTHASLLFHCLITFSCTHSVLYLELPFYHLRTVTYCFAFMAPSLRWSLLFPSPRELPQSQNLRQRDLEMHSSLLYSLPEGTRLLQTPSDRKPSAATWANSCNSGNFRPHTESLRHSFYQIFFFFFFLAGQS